MEEASKLVGAGKKFVVTGRPVEAVNVLQEACAMLAKKYGDTADECGEAFFWCGKALLDLARMENSVLGNALEGVPEEDGEEDKPEDKSKDSNVESTENVDEKTRDELRVQVYDAMAEKKKEDAEDGKAEKLNADSHQGKMEKAEGDEENASEAGEGKSKTKEKENEEETDQEPAVKEEERPGKDKNVDKQEESTPKEGLADEEEDGDSETEGGAEEQGGVDATAEKDSEDEDVGNLQLAWEMLELAKVIYKRKDTKEDQLMAAQAHLKLGEVSAESGNYAQALEDFQECLKLQVAHLDSDSRLLAETHYQLGVTYSLDLQYSKTIEALKNSISVIKSRLERLQEALDKADGPEALPDERKEMDELRALLPEIQEKVEDATEGLKTASTAAEAVKGILDGASISDSGVNSGDASSSSAIQSTLTSRQDSSVPVSDISHLVRKKRKPEESPVKEGDAKKAKQDGGQADDVEPRPNGVHKANGDSNGLAENMETAK
ncbi:histone-binding protein N1/N2-like [Xenentodon cancila]